MNENKLKIVASVCAAFIGIAALLSGILLMPYLPKSIAVMNLVLGIAVFIFAFAIMLEKDYTTGDYECSECSERFKPTFKEYLWAIHTPMKRRLKCPHCLKKSFCKRKLD